MVGFTTSPSPQALKDEENDGDIDDDDEEEEDEDEDELFWWQWDDCYIVTFLLSFMIRSGSSFGYDSSHILRGRVSIWHFC